MSIDVIDDAKIREAAYFFWLGDGQPDGCEKAHWLRAVDALANSMPLKNATLQAEGTPLVDHGPSQHEEITLMPTPTKRRGNALLAVRDAIAVRSRSMAGAIRIDKLIKTGPRAERMKRK